MSQKIIFSLIFAAAAVAAGIYLFNKPASAPEQENTFSGEDEVVVYSDAGYEPSLIRVEPGATVIFENQSQGLMWTASDAHPTHLILPELDSLKGVPRGDSYSFTFTKTGSWTYHNHLRPERSGAVIVE